MKQLILFMTLDHAGIGACLDIKTCLGTFGWKPHMLTIACFSIAKTVGIDSWFLSW